MTETNNLKRIMASIPAFFKLLRLPNMVIVAATLYGFRYLVILPYYSMSGTPFQISSFTFGSMVAVAMLIAATGYIINDFYDVEIDRINRPDRPAVSSSISLGSIKTMAIMLSIIVLAGTALISFLMDSLIALPIPLLTLAIVWLYAMYLKKSFVWGNLAVAIMSCLTLGTVWLFEWFLLNRSGIELYEVKPITYIVVGIMVFAFMLSFIREIVKDLEDQEGDRSFGCRSLPIVKGERITKKVLFLLSGVLILLLIKGQSWLLRMDLPMVAWWLVPAVELPMVVFIFRLTRAGSQKDFHSLSSLVKWIMVGGIASMAIIWLNFRF